MSRLRLDKSVPMLDTFFIDRIVQATHFYPGFKTSSQVQGRLIGESKEERREWVNS